MSVVIILYFFKFLEADKLKLCMYFFSFLTKCKYI